MIQENKITSDPDYLSCKGLVTSGNFSELMKAGQLLVGRYPNDYRSHLTLGRAYLGLKLDSLATEAIQKSIAIKSDNGESWFYLGLVYLREAKNGDACAAIELAVKFDPIVAGGRGWAILGSLYHQSKRDQDAIRADEYYIELIKGHEQNTDSSVFISLGIIYADHQEFDQAKLVAARLMGFDPDQAAILSNYIKIKEHPSAQ